MNVLHVIVPVERKLGKRLTDKSVGYDIFGVAHLHFTRLLRTTLVSIAHITSTGFVVPSSNQERNMKRAMLLFAMLLAFAFAATAQDQPATTTSKSGKTHTASAKGSTITGCISADKGANGNYTISNGRYKKGVDVTGNDDISKHAGHKVQLTGSWTTPGKTFDETKIKHIADTCTVPSGKKTHKATTSEGTNPKS